MFVLLMSYKMCLLMYTRELSYFLINFNVQLDNRKQIKQEIFKLFSVNEAFN